MPTVPDLPDLEDAVALDLPGSVDTVDRATRRRRTVRPRTGRRPLPALGLVALVLVVTIGSARFGRLVDTPSPAPPTAAVPAPTCQAPQRPRVPPPFDFAVPTSQGTCFTGFSLLGKRVVLYSFEVSEPLAARNAYVLSSLARLLAAEDVLFVAVALPGDSVEQVEAFDIARDVTGFPELLDPEQAVGETFRLLRSNELCFLRPDGTSTTEAAGYINVSDLARRAAALTA